MALAFDILQPSTEQPRERVRFLRQQAEKLKDEQKRQQLLALAEKLEKDGKSEPAAGGK